LPPVSPCPDLFSFWVLGASPSVPAASRTTQLLHLQVEVRLAVVVAILEGDVYVATLEDQVSSTVAVLWVVPPAPCLSAMAGVTSNAAPHSHHRARLLVRAASLEVVQHMSEVASVEDSLVVAMAVSASVVPNISAVC